MNSKTLARGGFVALLVVVVVGQHAWYWPQLPERVATHFGVDGKPNDWMSRAAATVLLASIQLGLPLFLIFVNFLAGRLPDSLLNIPNREYWLAPERRVATLDHMGRMIDWIAILAAAFLFVLSHLTFLANRDGTALNLPAFISALALFLFAVFAIAGYSLMRFKLPSNQRSKQSNTR